MQYFSAEVGGQRGKLRTILAVGLTKFAVLFERFHCSDCTIRLLYYVFGLLATVCRMVAATKRERECVGEYISTEVVSTPSILLKLS